MSLSEDCVAKAGFIVAHWRSTDNLSESIGEELSEEPPAMAADGPETPELFSKSDGPETPELFSKSDGEIRAYIICITLSLAFTSCKVGILFICSRLKATEGIAKLDFFMSGIICSVVSNDTCSGVIA